MTTPSRQLPRQRDSSRGEAVPILERDAFLDSFVDYAAEAAAGASRLVFLAGEAGVGKTTLLELLRQRLPHVRWAVGACDGSFTPQPLSPLFDIAPQLGGAIAAACAEDAPRDRLFRVLLEQLAPPALFTVVVVEDAHWADEATMDLVRFLGRRLRESPTLLVVSYRDDSLAADHPLRLTLGDLTPERSMRRMTLAPLSPAAVDKLAANSGVSGGELFALTGGNPFFVNEVLSVNKPELPISARDVVLARVARLSSDARAVVNAIAVLGTDVDVATIKAMAAPSAGIEEAIEHGVLVSKSSGLCFRHELTRIAVEDAIPKHQLRELHAAALAALRAATDAELARLAHHAEGALDTDAVIDYATRAGKRAQMLSAHREAAAQFSRALRFAGGRQITERAELHDLLATELILVDDGQQADIELTRSVELWKAAGDRLRYGDSLRQLAAVRARAFDSDCHRLIDESIAVLEELPPSAELAWAHCKKAGLLIYEDPHRCIESARHARKVLELSGIDDRALVADAIDTEGCGMWALGDDGVPMIEEALAVALRGQVARAAGRAYGNLAFGLCTLADYPRALRYAEDGLRFCEDHEIGVFLHHLRGSYVEILDKLGRWDEAIAICEHMLNDLVLSLSNRSGPCLTLGTILARRGDGAAAAPLLAEAHTIVKDMGRYEYELRAVELAWLAGDTDEARARATRLAAAPNVAAELESVLAVWLRRLGEDVTRYDLKVDRVRTRQLTEPWSDVAAMWAELGAPYEQALALYDSGEEEPMREAIAILDGLGASAAVNVVRAEMRRRGYTSIPRGVRAATREDRLGLTRRQREVLDLMAEGLTNAEIGSRLFLSERTVDHHVGGVLAKLGVESRREAVRLAAST